MNKLSFFSGERTVASDQPYRHRIKSKGFGVYYRLKVFFGCRVWFNKLWNIVTQRKPFHERTVVRFPSELTSIRNNYDVNKTLLTKSSIDGDAWKQLRYQKKLISMWDNLQNTSRLGLWLGQDNKDAVLESQDALLWKYMVIILVELSGKSIAGVLPSATPRQRYKRFIGIFRKANEILIKCKLPNTFCHNSRAFLNEVAHALFVPEGRSDFHHKLVQTVKQEAVLSNRSACFVPLASCQGESIVARLAQTQQLIESQHAKLENASGYCQHVCNLVGLTAGDLGIGYDPSLQGNIPDVHFTFQEQGRAVCCIRMGTPTRQILPAGVHITPEFRCFLESQESTQHHLYINRQRRTGVEGYRSDKLERLQASKDMQEKLTVVTLSADGSFYKQEKPCGGDGLLADLNAEIIDVLDGNRDGFFFPISLREKLSAVSGDFRTYLQQCLDQAAQELGMESNIRLSRNQRRAFLFHFLNKTLVMSLIHNTNATTYNHSCKDCIDRGCVANAYLFLWENRPLNRATPDELEAFLQTVEGKLNAPAIETKKRKVINLRHEDLSNALKTLDCWNTQEGVVKSPDGEMLGLA
ncbi:MAG: hypothetical protein KAG53_10780 [Endozoicomonadaceae bacterium]|nr:hypothetical protein [Endozoicomonadaceae bacterium]